MSWENKMIVTVYGHGDTIDKIAISNFEESSRFRYDENSRIYCNTINKLELREGWVFAKAVPENTPFSLNILLPIRFEKMILNLDDRELRKIVEYLDRKDLVIAIAGCNEDVLAKVLKNVSGRAQEDIKSDIEFRKGYILEKESAEKQEKIINLVLHSIETGAITANPEDWK